MYLGVLLSVLNMFASTQIDGFGERLRTRKYPKYPKIGKI